MALKDNLKSLRDRRGMTQEELAEKAGLHRVTVAELEAGRGGDSKWTTIERLASALGCKPTDLTGAAGRHARG